MTLESHGAYEKLRTTILSLELSPGTTLTERGLETRLSTSRTTVRSALARLENEGLVQRDGRGYLVAPIDLGEMMQALEFRQMLEAEAVALVVERASDGDLAALEIQLDAGNAAQSLEHFMRGATDFHLSLAMLSGNAFLRRSLEDVLTRLSRSRWFEAQAQGGQRQASQDHHNILKHLQNRDAAAAQAEIKAHLARSRERLLEVLLKTQGLQIRGQGKDVKTP
jgi:DNA-binding GntR family transcriptional regulator